MNEKSKKEFELKVADMCKKTGKSKRECMHTLFKEWLIEKDRK